MARLIWRREGDKRTDFPLRGTTAVIGREGGVDCRLDARSVSRRHARIELRDGEFFLTDLGSRNGTMLDGVRLSGEARLSGGEKIQLGEEVLDFDLESLAGQPTPGSLETEPLAGGSQARLELARTALLKAGDVLPRREGKFQLLGKLGQGGMGVVFHALDLDSNREVAVKFIKSDIGRKEAFLDFFHNREAVLAREIQHPNVITVYEHGVGASRHYISMEYVPGWNLYALAKRRRLSPAEVLEILRQIACGLAAAHRHGVVHSDIKPANVLLTRAEENPSVDERLAEEASRAREENPSGILEFEDGGSGESAAGAPSREGEAGKYDAALMAEIRRRLGEPSIDAVLDPPFFPRASEASFLEHYFEKARGGRGCFLLVEGDSGTGKDRLISEFLANGDCFAAARSEDRKEGMAPLFEFDCSRIEGMPLLYEQVFGLRPIGNLTSRRMLAEILERWEDDPEFRVVRILNLANAAQLASDLIDSCGRLMKHQGLLLLASLDPEQLRKNGRLKPLLERLSLATKELYLRPLTEYQVQRFLQQLFPGVLFVTDLARDLYRLSQGNFNKLLEVLRGFFERGILRVDSPSGGLLYRPRAQEFELEEGKNLYEKYRAYGKFEQTVLRQAAFMGATFLFEPLIRMNDINEMSLYFIVRTLIGDGFFQEVRSGWFTFTNGALQKYLANLIPLSERPVLHRKISRLLHAVPVSDSPELHALKARHLAGYREYAKAVQHLLEGAYLARNDYRVDFFREMFQEVLRIYRMLGRQDSLRKEVTGVLRNWFHRDGNWYEILGELGSEIPRPAVKITDFGISFRRKDDERGYQVEKRPALGTPRYMAPERSRGEYGGFKSDIFALGIITYELAVGEPPFPELKGIDVIRANRTQDIRMPRAVLRNFPEGMEDLVAGMLQRDPAKRWDAERVVREVTWMQFEGGPAWKARL